MVDKTSSELVDLDFEDEPVSNQATSPLTGGELVDLDFNTEGLISPLIREGSSGERRGGNNIHSTQYAEAYYRANRRDEGIDYENEVGGVGFRAKLSLLDTEEEKRNWLNKSVSPEGWGQDSKGEYFLTPEGASRIGEEITKPTMIDRPGATPKDIADIAGHVPEIIGSVGAGMRASGLGFFPGVVLTAAGAGMGKLLGETGEELMGMNDQTAAEVFGMTADATSWALLAETVVRGARPLGRMMGGPNMRREFSAFNKQAPAATKVPKATLDVIDHAETVGKTETKSGVRFAAPQVVGGKILARLHGVGYAIFGDLNEINNTTALTRGAKDLVKRSGGVDEAGKTTVEHAFRSARKYITLATEAANKSKVRLTLLKKQSTDLVLSGRSPSGDTGDIARGAIIDMHTSFKEWAGGTYGQIDSLFGKQPVVPMSTLKKEVASILEEVPGNKGTSAFLPKEVKGYLDEIMSMDDFITLKQMQAVRSRLFEAKNGDPDILKGLGTNYATRLHKSATKSFDLVGREIPNAEFSIIGADGVARRFPAEMNTKMAIDAADLLKATNKQYAEGIKHFDDVFIAKLTRDPSKAGALDPSTLVDVVSRSPLKAKKLRAILNESDKRLKKPIGSTWKEVQEDHLGALTKQAMNIDNEVRGAALYRLIGSDKNYKMLELVQGKEKAAEILKLSKNLAAADGKVSLAAIDAGGDMAKTIKSSMTKQAKLDGLMADDFINIIQKRGIGNIDGAVDFMLRKGNTGYLIKAKQFYGETSKEWMTIRELSMGRILKRSTKLDPDDATSEIFDFIGLRNSMKDMGSKNLSQVFGRELYKDLEMYAKVGQMATQTRTLSGGLIAATIAVKPLANLSLLSRIRVVAHLLNTRWFLKYMTTGVLSPKKRKGADALARVAAMTTAAVDDETKGDIEDTASEIIDDPKKLIPYAY